MDTAITSKPPSRYRLVGSSWTVSLVLHCILLIILFAVSFAKIDQTAFLLTISTDAIDTAESFQFLQIPFEASELSEEKSNFDAPPVSAKPIPNFQPVELQASLLITSAVSERVEFASDIRDFLETTQQSTPMVNSGFLDIRKSFGGRSAEAKARLLSMYGGSQESEAAVSQALQWIAAHQSEDGSWSFAHQLACNGQCDHPGNFGIARNGATAIAILPFLGAGYTHRSEKYQDNVKNGLQYLITNMNRGGMDATKFKMDGSWFEAQGTMYSHCLATIALCEAYAMTGDSWLREPAQAGINFLVASQNRSDGGWRYSPGDRGDTSVVGWALMALKSAQVGELEVPDETIKRVYRFLDRVSSNQGATFGYMAPDKNPHGLAATSSIGLLCQMYSGKPKSHRGIERGIAVLSKIGPQVEHAYYTYYSTQVMHHHGGDEWKNWNESMRDEIVRRQIKSGHPAGSWMPNRELDGMAGGRLYMTAMMAMTLEVYYRHMPLYTDQVLDDEFEL